MAKGKIIATIMLVVGVAILLMSALADILGLGGSPHVLGYKQMAGVAVGAIVAIVGAVLYWRTGR